MERDFNDLLLPSCDKIISDDSLHGKLLRGLIPIVLCRKGSRYSMSETTPGDRLTFARSCLILNDNRGLNSDRSLGWITSGRLPPTIATNTILNLDIAVEEQLRAFSFGDKLGGEVLNNCGGVALK